MQQAATSIKEKLHQRIEGIDDEKMLEALYVVTGGYRKEDEDIDSSDEVVKELEKREADHLAGKTASYSLEEFKSRINKRYGY